MALSGSWLRIPTLDVRHPHEVQGDGREGGPELVLGLPDVAQLAPGAHCLDPAKALLDTFAHPLAESVARMPGRPQIDSAPAVGGVLGDVRGDLALAQLLDEGPRVVALVGSQRDPLPRQAPPVEHHEGGIALRCPGCLGDQEVEDEPTAVLHEDVSSIGEARLLAPALAREERFGVGP